MKEIATLRYKKMAARIERLQTVVEQIREVPAGEPLTRSLVAKLILLWGNYGYAANVTYLRQVDCLFRETEGPVLECGSGVTTLLLGLLAEKDDREVWVFEDHQTWARHLKGVLAAFALKNINVCHTPLRDYDSFVWFKQPMRTFPNAFGAVVCDGPPLHIRRGRYGLLPILGDRLPAGCRILLNDVKNARSQKTIECWSQERNLSWHSLGILGRSAEVVLA